MGHSSPYLIVVSQNAVVDVCRGFVIMSPIRRRSKSVKVGWSPFFLCLDVVLLSSFDVEVGCLAHVESVGLK